MLYQDNFQLADDAEQYQLYPFGTEEEYLIMQAMSGHGKEPNFFPGGMWSAWNPQSLLTDCRLQSTSNPVFAVVLCLSRDKPERSGCFAERIW